ncbi:ubiquinol-cytochrome-c reductase complex assembly factor 1 isoform X2 [Coccinella septempunctata]|uniref:ubiquinol-cytochrome-c reductase complex assembly factor 1 isoform X2 n=1 Tax=Coccinella septempunctata TaxID=41139 RepID=UPI001D06D259|nr:ubiquinol-cytochrome-c reductase complex assembly factor 1 isoform X2 [Coccinella septempunctata]
MINIQRLLRIPLRMQMEVSRRNIYSLNPNKMYILTNHNREIPQLSARSMTLFHPETIKKFLSAVPFLQFNKTKLKVIAYDQYEILVDNIDYIEFFEELDLPDTFYSWFVVTELHLWMLSARAMAEGTDGRLIRNTLVEALWADVLQRVKKLGSRSNPIDIRGKIVELSEQLQASYIAYDEGLLSDDTVLAGALWRRFYQRSDIDVEHLEKLVKYIRKNMRLLENLSTEQFFKPKDIKWCPLIS